MELRVGNGFDVHAFVDDPSRTLMLGGVAFPGDRPLAGHSDGDVIAHACAEALLGAAGLGDLGVLFPDDDPAWKHADSLGLLREVAERLTANRWRVMNIDCSVVAEFPRLAPLRSRMEVSLSEAAGGPVTVQGRRAEGLGALGRAEGIGCWASALIVREEP